MWFGDAFILRGLWRAGFNPPLQALTLGSRFNYHVKDSEDSIERNYTYVVCTRWCCVPRCLSRVFLHPSFLDSLTCAITWATCPWSPAVTGTPLPPTRSICYTPSHSAPHPTPPRHGALASQVSETEGFCFKLGNSPTDVEWSLIGPSRPRLRAPASSMCQRRCLLSTDALNPTAGIAMTYMGGDKCGDTNYDR